MLRFYGAWFAKQKKSHWFLASGDSMTLNGARV